MHRILVVDDTPSTLMLYKALFSTEGYEVSTAACAEDALEAIRTSRPEIILMDVQLPGMDGLALTRDLKADPATRDIVIVAVTAFSMKVDEAKALQAGCDGYLAKPVGIRVLAETISRHLAAKRSA